MKRVRSCPSVKPAPSRTRTALRRCWMTPCMDLVTISLPPWLGRGRSSTYYSSVAILFIHFFPRSRPDLIDTTGLPTAAYHGIRDPLTARQVGGQTATLCVWQVAAVAVVKVQALSIPAFVLFGVTRHCGGESGKWQADTRPLLRPTAML